MMNFRLVPTVRRGRLGEAELTAICYRLHGILRSRVQIHARFSIASTCPSSCDIALADALAPASVSP